MKFYGLTKGITWIKCFFKYLIIKDKILYFESYALRHLPLLEPPNGGFFMPKPLFYIDFTYLHLTTVHCSALTTSSTNGTT